VLAGWVRFGLIDLVAVVPQRVDVNESRLSQIHKTARRAGEVVSKKAAHRVETGIKKIVERYGTVLENP